MRCSCYSLIFAVIYEKYCFTELGRFILVRVTLLQLPIEIGRLSNRAIGRHNLTGPAQQNRHRHRAYQHDKGLW